MTYPSLDCEWCGLESHAEDAHTILAQFSMHVRTLPELVDIALAEAEYYCRDARKVPPYAIAGVLASPRDRAEALAEEWLTLTEDERDEHASGFLNDLEECINATGRYVALSDGGNTGDWLVLDAIDYEE